MKKRGSVVRGALRRVASRLRGAVAVGAKKPTETSIYATPQFQCGASWSWRPPLWCNALRILDHSPIPDHYQLCDGIKLFHNNPDAAGQDITVRHVDQDSTQYGTPYGICVQSDDFSGDFLSMAIDLPKRAFEGATRDDLFKFEMQATCDTSIHGLLRLNIINGPNTDQISNAFTINNQPITIELDLAYSHINTNRIERGWIDVIFHGPLGPEFWVHDITMSRLQRAEF